MAVYTTREGTLTDCLALLKCHQEYRIKITTLLRLPPQIIQLVFADNNKVAIGWIVAIFCWPEIPNETGPILDIAEYAIRFGWDTGLIRIVSIRIVPEHRNTEALPILLEGFKDTIRRLVDSGAQISFVTVRGKNQEESDAFAKLFDLLPSQDDRLLLMQDIAGFLRRS